MCFLTKLWFMSIVSIITCTSLYAGESELERLKSGFKNKINSVIAPLVKRHKTSLLSLEKSLANVSNIEDALLVREERMRISEVEGMDLLAEVPDAPEKLRSQCQRFNREMSSSVKVWEKKYDQALVSLESRLTKSGKLNEALLVKNELIYFRRKVNSRAKKSDEDNTDQNGILDYALASKGAKAKAQEGAEFLIDGKTDHSGNDGFAWGSSPTDFVISLPKVTKIQEINFLLHNEDKSREYLYQLFVMRDDESEWEMVADHGKKPSKGWQKHKFPPVKLKNIKITGLFNSANKNFHIVEVEAR